MTFGMFVVFLLLASASEAKNNVRRNPVHSENIVLGKNTTLNLPVINSRGIGYYYASFYAGAGCVGTPTYQEGYATGKCLTLGTPPGVISPQQLSTTLSPAATPPYVNAPPSSIRMDCSATRKFFVDQSFSTFVLTNNVCIP